MKNVLVAIAAALTLASTGAIAQQESAAGSGAAAGTIGGIATGTIVAGAVAAGVMAAVVSNNRSESLPGTQPETPEPSCQGNDPLVGDVCIGTTTTVTVTGTGTNTSTIAVPVTFTYAPTVQ